jgi:hypothetical protein
MSILRQKQPVPPDNMMQMLDEASMDGEVEINALLGEPYYDGDKHHKKPHHHAKKKPLTMEQHLEYIYWHTFWQTWIQAAILGLLIAVVAVGTGTTLYVGYGSDQFKRAITLVDRVHEMHDYTKTMTDVTTGSQEEIKKAFLEYDVNGMINTVKKMVDTGGAIVNNLKPETLQQASEMGTKLIETLQHIDFEQGKALMTHLNEWATQVDPHKVSTFMFTPTQGAEGALCG